MSKEDETIECRGWVYLSDTASSFAARQARQRVLYGKKIGAIQHAILIFKFAKGWSDDLLNGRATQGDWKSFFQDKDTQGLMRGLMRHALESPDYLRDVLDTLIQLKNGSVNLGTARPIALELVNAYGQCTAFPPTLPEVREIFKARRKLRWPGDFYTRRLLHSLCLQLRPAKRGAPKKRRISTVNG